MLGLEPASPPLILGVATNISSKHMLKQQRMDLKSKQQQEVIGLCSNQVRCPSHLEQEGLQQLLLKQAGTRQSHAAFLPHGTTTQTTSPQLAEG